MLLGFIVSYSTVIIHVSNLQTCNKGKKKLIDGHTFFFLIQGVY